MLCSIVNNQADLGVVESLTMRIILNEIVLRFSRTDQSKASYSSHFRESLGR